MRLSIIKALVSIKNGCRLNKRTINLKFNKKYLNLLTILYKEGFIQSFFINSSKLSTTIYLRFFQNKNILSNLKFISTPSRQKFISYFNLCRINTKKIFVLLTTNKGLLTLPECKKQKIGGKILFLIF